MKRAFLFLALVILITGGVFAQSFNNWISGEVTVIGAGLRYEYMLTPQWSVGGNAYWSSLFFFWNELSIDITGRFYPFGGNRTSIARGLYVGLGLGFHIHTSLFDIVAIDGWYPTSSDEFGIAGIGVTPDIGWKIDVGAPGGFYIAPGIKFPITLGWTEMYKVSDPSKKEDRFNPGFGVVPYFGLGFAF
jgi:hypothetical protein